MFLFYACMSLVMSFLSSRWSDVSVFKGIRIENLSVSEVRHLYTSVYLQPIGPYVEIELNKPELLVIVS